MASWMTAKWRSLLKNPERERGLVKIGIFNKKKKIRTEEIVPVKTEQSGGAFRKNGVLSGYFHQLWLDTSDALSVPGTGPGTFLNSQRGL